MYGSLIDSIRKRALSGGGFAEIPGKGYRPDATAWVALALAHCMEDRLCRTILDRLKLDQMEDGRVCLDHAFRDAFWPTSLAAMAWSIAPRYQDVQSRAVQFLLGTTGRHWKKENGAPLGHDTAIHGWPWVAETHSWVEPTALALCALIVAGEKNHPRVNEGAAMLLDRQLPQRGWNYGNSLVFGQELHPMPDATGLALQALAGMTSRSKVERSLDWLATRAGKLSTPFSLSWAILGLSAWDIRPAGANDLIADCLRRQERYGSYPTSHLCLLQVALNAPNGLVHLLAEK
jgi:hypothetical protein